MYCVNIVEKIVKIENGANVFSFLAGSRFSAFTAARNKNREGKKESENKERVVLGLNPAQKPTTTLVQFLFYFYQYGIRSETKQSLTNIILKIIT